jgi:hypothetical protein
VAPPTAGGAPLVQPRNKRYLIIGWEILPPGSTGRFNNFPRQFCCISATARTVLVRLGRTEGGGGVRDCHCLGKRFTSLRTASRMRMSRCGSLRISSISVCAMPRQTRVRLCPRPAAFTTICSSPSAPGRRRWGNSCRPSPMRFRQFRPGPSRAGVLLACFGLVPCAALHAIGRDPCEPGGAAHVAATTPAHECALPNLHRRRRLAHLSSRHCVSSPHAPGT